MREGGRHGGGITEPIGNRVKPLRLEQHPGLLTNYYSVQPTVCMAGKRLVSSRLMFGVTRGAMAFPRLLRPPAYPIKFEVVFDAVLSGKTSE